MMIIHILILALFLSGCSSEKKKTKKPRFKEVVLQIEDNMNHGISMPVDLVLVYDADILKKLNTLSAKDYFQKLPNIVAENPYGILIYRWEPIPGQTTMSHNIDEYLKKKCNKKYKKEKLVGVIIFSLYNNEKGNHRINATNYTKAFITLGEDFASVVPRKVLHNHSNNNKKYNHNHNRFLPRELIPFRDYEELSKYMSSMENMD